LSRLGRPFCCSACSFWSSLGGLLLFPCWRPVRGLRRQPAGYLAALQELFSEWSEKLTSDYNAFLRQHGLEASMPTLDLQKYVNDSSANTRPISRVRAVAAVSRRRPDQYRLRGRGDARRRLLHAAGLEEMVEILDGLSPPRYRKRCASSRMKSTRRWRLLARAIGVCLFLGSWYALVFRSSA